MASSKELWMEHAKRLREAAALQDPVSLSVIAMVKSYEDDLKERLVDAEGEDMLRVQGAVRSAQKLYHQLTVTPPAINQE